jgi:hypothetical protein
MNHAGPDWMLISHIACDLTPLPIVRSGEPGLISSEIVGLQELCCGICPGAAGSVTFMTDTERRGELAMPVGYR